MNVRALSVGVLIGFGGSCASQNDTAASAGAVALSDRADELTAFTSFYRWPNATVSVCFTQVSQNDAGVYAGPKKAGVDYEGWQTAFVDVWKQTWGSATSLNFVNLGICDGGANYSLKYQISADGCSGGFCGNSPGQTCGISLCNETPSVTSSIRRIAVHEMGHGLGFGHEHQRSIGGVFEEPICSISLTTADGGPDYDVIPANSDKITVYDRLSVMNYCADLYWGRSSSDYLLTRLDSLGAQLAYPASLTSALVGLNGYLTQTGWIIRSDSAVVPKQVALGAIDLFLPKGIDGGSAMSWKIDSFAPVTSTPPRLPATTINGYGAGWKYVSSPGFRTFYNDPYPTTSAWFLVNSSLHTAITMSAVQ